MKLSKLRSVERQLYKLRKMLEKHKADPDAKDLFEIADREWSSFYKLHDQRAAGLAAKRDRGEVLYTVFRPVYDGRAISEKVRTPRRLLSRTVWRGLFSGQLEQWPRFTTEVRELKWHTPERDFTRLMDAEEKFI